MAYKDRARMIAYNNQYNAAAYDRINLTMPKGEKEVIKDHAAACGESVNEFLRRAARETMERDKEGGGG